MRTSPMSCWRRWRGCAPLRWQAYTEQEWTTARQAYAMEQAILLALKAQGFATRRERAACSITDMMRVWNGERDKHLPP